MSLIDEGEIDFEHADDANIPINIFIVKDDSDKFCLTADNYMPRKGLGCDAYKVYGERNELEQLIQKHVLPLYQKAVEKLQNMIQGSNDSLYYWG